MGTRGFPVLRWCLLGKPARYTWCNVVVHMLVLLVFGQPGGAQLTAVAGHLHAAPFGLGEVGVEVVDPDRAMP